MLVLTRKIDQTIVIAEKTTGKKTTVVVLGINRNEVKFGFQAPGNVLILREELMDTEYSPHTPRENEGMLVLTRKIQGKGVFIDKNTYFRVLGVDRNRVKLGFEASDEVKIRRGELGELIDEGRPRRSKEQF